MLRFSLTLTLATLAFAAATVSADVYRYVDEKGNVQYTDKPATLPAERLNVQSQKTDTVAAQQRSEADLKRIQEADRASSKAAGQQSNQAEATELTAKDKAERCVKARERYDATMNSLRLYQPGENGERRYLSDAEIDAARNSAKVTMDELCK
jgi:hypothetical protein